MADETLRVWRGHLSPRGFDLRRVLGRGPGYVTFEARAVYVGESVALTIFAGHAGQKRRQRFQQAFERRASLRHPHLLSVHSFGDALGYPFLALEMCEAPSLSTRLRYENLGLKECLLVLRGIAKVVDAAGRGGVAASEITPDAILVDPVRGGLLGDLGVAREAVGPVPATLDSQLPYRPPEERRGQPVDSSAGVYSLGAVLFTALTGARPYEVAYPRAGHLLSLQPATVRRWRPDRDLPPGIDRVVARAMARDPEARYRTARGLMQAATMALRTADLASCPRRARPAAVAPTPQAPRPSRASARERTSALPAAVAPQGKAPAPLGAPAARRESVVRPRARPRWLSAPAPIARPAWLRAPARIVAALIAVTVSGVFGLLLGTDADSRTATAELKVNQEVAPVPAVSPATRALPATIERLRRRRDAAMRRLARATVPQRQARASGQLERAYLAAGRTVGWSAGTGPHLDWVRAALWRTAGAYGQLAEASAAGDASRYDAARKAIRRGERSVRRALDAVD